LLTAAIDQTSKIWVLSAVGIGRAAALRTFAIRVVLNRHGAGGARMARFLPIGIWLAEVALLVAFVELVPRYQSASMQVALGAALGGATGNLVDQVWRGHVVDFIDLGFWPVFNIADAAIVAGALLAALQIL
jgi:signal peptidase II